MCSGTLRVRDWTEETFGSRQVAIYEELIVAALQDLRENPLQTAVHDEVHPEARLLRIARPGRPARHVFLYRVRGGVVEVAAFLHDHMAIERRIPGDGDAQGPARGRGPDTHTEGRSEPQPVRELSRSRPGWLCSTRRH